jgi:OmpA-OmpF porin, OOP family
MRPVVYASPAQLRLAALAAASVETSGMRGPDGRAFNATPLEPLAGLSQAMPWREPYRGPVRALAVAGIWLALALVLTRPGGTCAAGPETDAPGCIDPQTLPRFEGARILGCQVAEKDETVLPLASWNADPDVSFWESSVRLDGRRARVLYAMPPGRSSHEVIRAYRKALVGLGYEVLFECAGFTSCGAGVDAVYTDEAYGKRLASPPAAAGAFAQDTVREPRILVAKRPADNGSAYVFVFAAHQDNPATPQAGKATAAFVEEVVSQGPEQHLILLRADELAQGIDLDGHIPVYGIYFDPDLPEIKPESRDQLEEIARLLRERPDLSLHVVGHTDNQGDLAHNLDLSRRRAETVVGALTRDYGIVPTRLSPHGIASLAPIAPNTAEDGRGMNRRIELVAQ